MIRNERVAELLDVGNQPDAVDPLVITPTPDLSELRKSGAASVDLRLGCWFVTLRQSRMPYLQIDEPTPQEQFTKMQYVQFGAEYFLHPQSFVLGVTLEWLRLPKSLGGYIIGRSSWGRRGLVIATAAGVHPGFKGCLVLELTNLGQIPVAIKPGMTVCQLFLHRAEGDENSYVDQSIFVGARKPTLGRVRLDNIARKLATQLP